MAGADVNTRTIDGKTPLMLAARNSNLGVIELLIEKGAVFEPYTEGPSPLFEAVVADNMQIVRYLIKNGADINHQDSVGRTAIFFASAEGNYEIAALLIHLGADINIATKDGRTPLHAANFQRHYNIADLLYNKNPALLQSEQSEEAIYSTALLYRYSSLKEFARGHSKEAVNRLEVAKRFFLKARDVFESRADELSTDITKAQMASAASVFLAGVSAHYQAKVNTVPGPNGKSVGIGVATYQIVNTDRLEKLKTLYSLSAKNCAADVQEIMEVEKCLIGGANQASCINALEKK